MSFDLMVFDPAAAPIDRAEFMEWYEQQIDWPEETLPCPTPLKNWLAEMQTQFPDFNVMTDDELELDEENDFPRGSDYSFGEHIIYVAFAWSAADEAYKTMRKLAQKHGVGFFNPSSGDTEIWRPQ